MLDTVRQVTTPELIELRLHPAGALPRVLAWTIDVLIQFGVFLLIASVLGVLGEFGIGISLMIGFLLLWFYPVVFEVLGKGATPGKRAFRLIVLHDDGTPIGWGPSFSRNLLRFADFLPAMYAAGLISMLLHHEFRRLGDIVAGTIVCYREPMARLPNVPQAPSIAPTHTLPRKVQQAIVIFAERTPGLTPARQEELASLIPELSHPAQQTGGLVSPALRGAARLVGLANFLVGR